DLTTALDTQTATSDILHVISQSPTDAKPVLHAIVESAVRLVSGQNSVLFRLIAGEAHVVAQSGLSRDSLTTFQSWYPGPLTGLLETAVVSRQPVHTADMLTDHRATELGRRLAQSQGHRAILFVPLLQGDIVIGVLSVSQSAPLPFTDSQIALLQTFADQAVIAIENERLFTETKEALERQTATSEILRAISRAATALEPIFDTIVENAGRVCDSVDTVLVLADGDEVVVTAHSGPIGGARIAGTRFPLSRGHVMGRAIIDAQPVHVDDLSTRPDFPEEQALALQWGHRTTLAVPLLRDGRAIGSLLVRRTEVRPFSDKHIEMLQTFADQAVIAIENVRLFKELEARTGELTRSVGELRALGEISQALSSTLDVDVVLNTIVTRANDLIGADGCTIFEYDEAT